MKRLRLAVLALVILTLGLIAWIVVRPMYPPADWLKVAAPRVAVMDHPLTLRLTLPAPSLPGLLMVDLHWSASHHESRGFLSRCPPLEVTPEGSEFTVEIPVPAQPDLKHVHAVIYLGPTPRWVDHWKVVHSEDIPVRVAGTIDTESRQLRPLYVYESMPDPEVHYPEAPLSRPLIATLWIVAGIFAWRSNPIGIPHPRFGPAEFLQWRHWLPLACLAAAFFELSSADVELGAWLRALAREFRLYEERRWLQQTAMLLALGGTALLTWVSLRRIRCPTRSIALLGLGLYAVLSLARLFSQHEIDQLLAVPVGPFPLVQIVKLAAALIVVTAVWPRRNLEKLPVTSIP